MIQIGSVVQLMAGGPRLTVIDQRASGFELIVAWFTPDGHLQTAQVHMNALCLAPPASN